MADKIKNEHRFCLVFATTLCWARQGSAGKGYKRLVYLLEKTDKEQENARFLDMIDNRLFGLSILDEQHRLHREYAVMIRCQGFRLEDKASAAFAEERYITRIKNRRHSPLQDNVVSAKLVQCDRIATIKGRYNVQEVEDEKREAKKSDPPLYFDEVVRLLQIHTKIQPSRCLISELEGQELFTYARIAILSEDDVVSVLHSLSLWIVPCDLYEKRQSSADEEQKKSEEAKESPPAASAFPRKRSKIPAAADKDKIQPRDSADEESYIIPRIVAYHDKPKKEDDYWYLPKLPASHTEDLSVLAICSKLKNECIENMEQRNLFENTSL